MKALLTSVREGAILGNPYLGISMIRMMREPRWVIGLTAGTALVYIPAIVMILYALNSGDLAPIRTGGPRAAWSSSLSVLGGYAYVAYFVISLILSFAMPGLAASAVSSEKEKGTIESVVVTLLKPREILSGLLWSRTLPAWIGFLLLIPIIVTGSVIGPFAAIGSSWAGGGAVLGMILVAGISIASLGLDLLMSSYLGLTVSSYTRSVTAAIGWTYGIYFGLLVMRWIFQYIAMLFLIPLGMVLFAGISAVSSARGLEGVALGMAMSIATLLITAAVTGIVYAVWRSTEHRFEEWVLA